MTNDSIKVPAHLLKDLLAHVTMAGQGSPNPSELRMLAGELATVIQQAEAAPVSTDRCPGWEPVAGDAQKRCTYCDRSPDKHEEGAICLTVYDEARQDFSVSFGRPGRVSIVLTTGNKILAHVYEQPIFTDEDEEPLGCFDGTEPGNVGWKF